MGQQFVNGIFSGSIYALFAVGYTLVFGVLDVLNLAHQAVFMVGRVVAVELMLGAYTAALLTLHEHWPFAAVIFAAGVAAAIVSLPLGLPVLRLRGVFLAIATLGFGEALRIFFVNWSYAGGALGLVGVPPLTVAWQIYLVLAALIFLLWRLRGSRIGYAFTAIRIDETAAQTMGINTTSYKLLAFVLGAGIAGIAGGFQAHLFLIVDPADYGYQRAVEILTYAVIGGFGSFAGPVLGAGLITLLPELLRSLTSLGISPGAVRQLVSGLILLLVIIFLPGGLVTALEWPQDRFSRARSHTADAERIS